MVTQTKQIRFVKEAAPATIRIVANRGESGIPNIPSVPEPPPHNRKLMRFDAAIDISKSDAKAFDTIKDGDTITDYRNVKVKGYLSTFGNMDRDGDVVKPGAFTETIPDFMRNPTMLIDHRNQVGSMVGSFTTVREDSKGLYVEGQLSNSPSDFMKHVRALVAEGHLRTMSMGGLFSYEPDGRTIAKVSLFEGTLTPIPANPSAIFSVREVTEHEAKWWSFDQGCETQRSNNAAAK